MSITRAIGAAVQAGHAIALAGERPLSKAAAGRLGEFWLTNAEELRQDPGGKDFELLMDRFASSGAFLKKVAGAAPFIEKAHLEALHNHQVEVSAKAGFAETRFCQPGFDWSA